MFRRMNNGGSGRSMAPCWQSSLGSTRKRGFGASATGEKILQDDKINGRHSRHWQSASCPPLVRKPLFYAEVISGEATPRQGRLFHSGGSSGEEPVCGAGVQQMKKHLPMGHASHPTHHLLEDGNPRPPARFGDDNGNLDSLAIGLYSAPANQSTIDDKGPHAATG